MKNSDSLKKLTHEDLIKIREFINDKIVQNPDVMFNDTIRGDDFPYTVDMVEVIVALYELLHFQVENEEYNYFFHWANKIGSWVDTHVEMFNLKGDN